MEKLAVGVMFIKLTRQMERSPNLQHVSIWNPQERFGEGSPFKKKKHTKKMKGD